MIMLHDGQHIPKKRKKRLPTACQRCREKKERCDGEVPGCSTCRKRHVPCSWGDERDQGYEEILSAAPSSNSLTLTPDMIESMGNGTLTLPHSKPVVSSEELQEILRQLPSREQVETLSLPFLKFAHHIYYCIDPDEFLASLDIIYGTFGQTDQFELLGHAGRLLFVFAASARQVSPTYLVAQTVAPTARLASGSIRRYLQDGLRCFEICQRHAKMSFALLQGTNVLLAWMLDCIPPEQSINLLDSAVRAAMGLGLDCLGSAKSDPSICVAGMVHGSALSWGARKLIDGDLNARELGRATWHGLRLFQSHDTVLQPTSDDDIASAFPGYDLAYGDECYNPFGCWQIFERLSVVLSDWKRILKRCQSLAILPDYRSMQDIATRLLALASNYAPIQHLYQVNDGTVEQLGQHKVAQRACSAMLVQLKILMVHRPLMGAGYKDPRKYGAFVSTAVQSANAILDGARRFRAREWSHFNSSFGRNAMLQAALALLLDLFHKPMSVGSAERDTAHSRIACAIEHLRFGDTFVGPTNKSSKGIADELESLLAACAQRSLSTITSTCGSQSAAEALLHDDFLPHESWLDGLDMHLFDIGGDYCVSRQLDAESHAWPKIFEGDWQLNAMTGPPAMSSDKSVFI